MSMNITIGRLEQDPSAQMVIQPEDGRWQVVVDKDGIPHLFVEVNVDAGPDTGGKPCKGMFCIEDMMELSIRDLMDEGEFEDPVIDPAEVAAAHEVYVKRRAESGIPCAHPGLPPRRKKP